MKTIGILSAALLVSAIAALKLIALAGAGEEGMPRQPTRLEPRRSQGQGVYLPRGKHNLMIFLQQFANASGKVVYIQETIAPEAEVELDENLEALDEKKVAAVLEASGFQISWEESYREESAYLVLPKLSRPAGKRGALIRPAADQEPDGSGGRFTRPALGGVEEGVRVFERIDGASRSYLVQLETRSREEAEEIARTISLILKDRRQRAEGK